jgi:hypothetical protein
LTANLVEALLFVADDLDRRAYPFAGAVRQGGPSHHRARGDRPRSERVHMRRANPSETPWSSSSVLLGEVPKKSRKCNPSQKSDKGERVKTKTSKTSTAPVLLDELVIHCGGSREAVDGWLRRFRVTPDSDWAGRPTIPADVAERIVQAHREAAAEAAELQSGYDAYLRDRTRRLVEAGDEAYRKTAEIELKKQYETNWAKGSDGRGFASVTYTNALTLWPRGRQMAREAALEARAKFDEREPQLRFEDWMKRRGTR